MADDREVVALDIAAKLVLTACANHLPDVRAMMAETGGVFTDRQWREIAKRVHGMTHPPAQEEFEAAYEYLDAKGDAE